VPLHGDVLIPDNWQLNYATSDSADDFVAVQLMRLCDKANVQHLKESQGKS
jgi:hypothetical protein